MIDTRLWRIKILGLSFSNHPSTEPDDPLMEVKDRKEDSSPKGIIPTFFLFRKNQTQFPRQFEGDLLPLEMLDQTIPPVGRISQPVFPDDFLVDSPLKEILSALLPFSTLGEKVMKIVRGNLVDLEEGLSFGYLLLLIRRKFAGRKFHSIPLGQFFHGLGKGKMSHFHQKGEGISSFPATEAVKNLLLFINHEGRSLLGMKGTESLIVLSCLFQGHIIRDNLQNAGPVPNFRNLFFG
jgi:hypothetical protein